MTTVFGREAELALVGAFLERATERSSALVLEGEPGIGKTTVWRHVVERAAARGMAVLSCRAVQAEAKLSFVSLADLLAPVADSVFQTLSGPQREALEVAMLRAAPSPGGVDGRAVGAGVHSALASLTASRPVLVALDDVQWLDRASAAALEFALRRLEDRPVAIAVTVRVEPGARSDPLGLGQALGASAERRRLGPLSLECLHELIDRRLGRTLPRRILARVAETSGGNPLFALELARMLIDTGMRPGLDDALPIPKTLASLVTDRVARLSPPSQEALLSAACLSSPTTALIEQAVGAGAAAGLEEAVAAELIDVTHERVRFSHPMFASAVYTSASPGARRRLHRRLTRLVTDVEEQARHTALAARRPDEQAAVLLDAAAAHARERGAPGMAGELLEWAARLTPEGDVEAVHRRLIGAAEHFYRAGHLEYARNVLASIADTIDERQRGHLLRLLGEIRYNEDSFDEAISVLDRALRYAAAPDATVDILLRLAFAHFSKGDVTQSLSAARRALQQAERSLNPARLAEALAVEANVAFYAGEGLDTTKVRRALALEDRSRDVQLLVRPSTIDALFALYAGRLSEAAAKLRTLRDWLRQGGENSDGMLLTWLSAAEIFRGNFAAAEQIAEEALSLAAQAGSDTIRGNALLHRAKARAFRGQVDAAKEDLRRSSVLLAEAGWTLVSAWADWTLGFLELSVEDYAAAESAFAPYVAAIEVAGVSEPFALNFLPDAIEVLIARGEQDRAERIVEPFEGRARQLGRSTALVGAMRCRALLLAARGDVTGAIDAAEESLRWAAQTEMPFERARTLLVHGQVRRRARHKQAARDSFEQALAMFEQLGAGLWAARAQADLLRVSHRSTPGALTATEQRVAELAASGMKNREVAAALFVSPKTVEANLARIYRKLGITTRAELGARMAQRAQA